ncbi:MAG: hypothetical protein HEQ24_06895 [Dolichospermum sp. BR01]|nr:hypothetical protein [Dolichospermum sp. BR01]
MCDSEALRRNRFLKMWGCDRCLGFWRVRSLLGMLGVRLLFWRCEDERSLFGDVWDAIAKRCCKQFAV